MQRDPRVSLHDAIKACEQIAAFTSGVNLKSFLADAKTRSAVERQFEIIGEALNRLKRSDETLLAGIHDAHAIIGFRNVIAHGYDVVDDKIVWDTVQRNIPALLEQLISLQNRL